MNYRNQEIVFSSAMVIVGFALFAHTFHERYQDLMSTGQLNSPMLYPRVLLGGWCALSLAMLFAAVRSDKTIKKVFHWKNVSITLAMIGLLVCAIPYVGFVVASTLFFFCFSTFIGYKRKGVAALTALAVSLSIYLIFEQLLGIYLPQPLWQLGG